MLHLKLLYGSAFKAPSPLLLYGVPHEVGDIIGNPALEPQWTTREFQRHESVYFADLIGDQNVIYPQYILRAGVSGRIPKAPLRAGVRLMYVGERPSSEMNALENLSMYDLPSYLMLNASISTVGIELVEGRETTISVVGRNLTNRKVADPGFAGFDYPLSPLTVFLSLCQEL